MAGINTASAQHRVQKPDSQKKNFEERNGLEQVSAHTFPLVRGDPRRRDSECVTETSNGTSIDMVFELWIAIAVFCEV